MFAASITNSAINKGDYNPPSTHMYMYVQGHIILHILNQATWELSTLDVDNVYQYSLQVIKNDRNTLLQTTSFLIKTYKANSLPHGGPYISPSNTGICSPSANTAAALNDCRYPKCCCYKLSSGSND